MSSFKPMMGFPREYCVFSFWHGSHLWMWDTAISYRRHRAIAVPSILFDHVRPGMGEFPTGVTGDCPKVNIPVASLDLFIGVWMNWLEDVWSCIFLFRCFLVMRCATNRRSWDAGKAENTSFHQGSRTRFPKRTMLMRVQHWEKEWAEVGNL